jgi:leader peptidase (prepilin peptidase)/N-methyltransferase
MGALRARDTMLPRKTDRFEDREVTPLPQAIVIGAALGFAILGAAAERLASVWPSEDASRRPPGLRTVVLAMGAGAAGGAVAWRSELPAWATAVYLGLLALMLLLTATDLEQRRLPHLLLDPLIGASLLFVPFNPSLPALSAIGGAVAAVAFLGLLGLVVRNGLALGDLYLVTPIGLLLGWPSVFAALFAAALLAAAASGVLLVSRRVGMKSYIPFGPFLVAGAVLALLTNPHLLGRAAALGGL